MRPFYIAAGCAITMLLAAQLAHAQQITPEFQSNYTLNDLGSVPGVPTRYGGLTFKHDDPNTLLIGGIANNVSAAVYAIKVVRGCDNVIIGFEGEATLYASAPRIDGGLTFGPDNVLFFTTYSNNTIGQIKPGSTERDKSILLGPLGVSGSTGTLAFVPEGFPGAGRLKIVSYNASRWYDTTVVPDGEGTFDIQPMESNVFIGNGPEGIAYVAAGSPQFENHSVLISEYSGGRVATYEVDDNGDPIPDTRRVMVTGLAGAEGATVDPLTNDFLFSTFGNGDRVLVVRGFELPDDLGDINKDGVVDVSDLLMVLSAWGACDGDTICAADVNGDCKVDLSDLLLVLSKWG